MIRITYHIWRFPKRDYHVIIKESLIRKIMRVARQSFPNETGGTLVGFYLADYRIAYIAQILDAKTGAQRSRRHFYRPSDNIDYQLRRIYNRSQGKIHYLGEWHTHPFDSPIPSDIDKDSMVKLAQSPSVATDTP